MRQKKQADSSYWYEVRRRRITASNFGKIARRRPSTNVTNLVQSLLYDSDKPVRSHALQWGRDNEAVARVAYCQYQNANGHSKLSTEASGFVVCLDEPWLGCSPDDTVTDSSSPEATGLAEYKINAHVPSGTRPSTSSWPRREHRSSACPEGEMAA